MPLPQQNESQTITLTTKAQAQRRQAEALADVRRARALEGSEAPSPEEARALLHELCVHQIELEMQNEELRRSQLALETSQARYFDLYDLAPLGYCTLSEQSIIVQANLTAATLLGVSRRDLVKRPLSRFLYKADQDIYYQYHKRLVESGEPQSCEIRMAKHDGALVWVHLTGASAQNELGEPVYRIMLIDVSARKQMELALQEKNTELEKAKRVADKANLAKSEFLSSMSHEFRTPLNAILGFTQLLEAGLPPPTDSQKHRIDQVLKAGWYLLELVNEILDLALIESGKVPLSMETLPVADVLQNCLALIEVEAQASDIRICCTPPTGHYFVLADQTHLKQVLLNLLSNAVKYNRAGGSVEVACSLGSAQRLRISVRDTGEGLSPEKLAQLFQPFNRLGQETGLVKGTGIGLVVSKRLIELMGGEIGVQSDVGLGSVFWIELAPTTAPPLAVLASEAVATVPAALRQGAALRTLLYVEDNAANMQLVEQLIARRPDMRFLCAEDGARGIALARTHQPDVILMDINLPDMSGLEALQTLRTDPATSHIPVLALSANAMESDISASLEAGFFRYLTKPIRINTFMEALDQALEFVGTA